MFQGRKQKLENNRSEKEISVMPHYRRIPETSLRMSWFGPIYISSPLCNIIDSEDLHKAIVFYHSPKLFEIHIKHYVSTSFIFVHGSVKSWRQQSTAANRLVGWLLFFLKKVYQTFMPLHWLMGQTKRFLLLGYLLPLIPAKRLLQFFSPKFENMKAQLLLAADNLC